MQMTSTCGKNKNVVQEAIFKCVEIFDVFCELLLQEHKETQENVNDVICTLVL